MICEISNNLGCNFMNAKFSKTPDFFQNIFRKVSSLSTEIQFSDLATLPAPYNLKTRDKRGTMSETEPRSKSLIIFGRDVSQIPCFRSSFLYGTLGGIGFGLAHFLFTSKVAKSVNYSIYAFSLVTVAFWMQCRMQYSQTKFEMLRLQQQLQERALFEGSERDPDQTPVEV